MYLNGDGIDQNVDYAYELLRDAAEQCNAHCPLNLARLLIHHCYQAPR